MKTFPLLSNVRHRAMIMPVSHPLAKLILISPSCWPIIVYLKLFLKW